MERTAVYIDLDALKANYQTACSLTQAKITCVLKSNAYGHGSVMIARTLSSEGCASFAVSCAREALELIDNGIKGEILVMSPCEKEYHSRLLGHQVLFTLSSVQDILELDASCEEMNCSVQGHLKIDTGFHRLGFEATQNAAESIVSKLKQCSRVHVTGLYSHLGLIERSLDEAQCARLISMRNMLASLGLPELEMHLGDSISLVRYPEWHFDRVRIGAFLYGVRPSRSEHMDFACRETIRFVTTVAQIHCVHRGETIGYGEERMDHDARIATLCAGYGDGYPRRMSNGKGHVIIAGKRAPVVGLVCMDQMMVDVTNIPEAARGMEAVLLGGGITYQEYADWAETNRNECLAMLSRRPVRIYMEHGRAVSRNDELLKEVSGI